MGIAYRSDKAKQDENPRYKTGFVLQVSAGALICLLSAVSYLYWGSLDIWYLEVPRFAFLVGILGIPIGSLLMLLAWAGTQTKKSDKTTITVLSVVASVLLVIPSFWLTTITIF